MKKSSRNTVPNHHDKPKKCPRCDYADETVRCVCPRCGDASGVPYLITGGN